MSHTSHTENPDVAKSLIGCKVSETEHGLIVEECRRRGMTASQLIRNALSEMLADPRFKDRTNYQRCAGLTNLRCARAGCGKKTGRLFGKNRWCGQCYSRIERDKCVSGGWAVGDRCGIKGEYVDPPGGTRRCIQAEVIGVDVAENSVRVRREDGKEQDVYAYRLKLPVRHEVSGE